MHCPETDETQAVWRTTEIESETIPKRLFGCHRRRTRARVEIPALEFMGRSAETDADKAGVFVLQYSSIYSQERLPVLHWCTLLRRYQPRTYLWPKSSSHWRHWRRHSLQARKPFTQVFWRNWLMSSLGRSLKSSTILWQQGKLPAEWKLAVICPLFKRGSRDAPVARRGYHSVSKV